LHLVVDQHRGVFVKTNVAAVGPALFLGGAYDDTLDHVALLHRRAGNGVLHGGHEDVADGGVAAPGPAQHLDAQDGLGAGVDGDDHRLLHLRGDNGALADLPTIRALSCFAHARSPVAAGAKASAASISFSRSTVRIRAMSRRTAFRRAELSSWPVTIWNRRLN